MKPQPRILPRNEAQQMVTDLNDVIENLIMLAEDADDSAKVLAFDTLVLVQTKRNILQSEIAQAGEEVQS